MVVSRARLPKTDSQERSAGAFVDFYRLHYPGAVRLAWLLTHDHSMTDDVVQDAFLRIRPRFDTVLDGQAYLRACVVNGCRDRARSSQRSNARLRLVSATMRSSVSDRPAELLDAVATLPYNQRAAVVLRFWADLPEIEIARTLGVRPSTVRSLVGRALTTLRRDLPK